MTRFNKGGRVRVDLFNQAETSDQIRNVRREGTTSGFSEDDRRGQDEAGKSDSEDQ